MNIILILSTGRLFQVNSSVVVATGPNDIHESNTGPILACPKKFCSSSKKNAQSGQESPEPPRHSVSSSNPIDQSSSTVEACAGPTQSPDPQFFEWINNGKSVSSYLSWSDDQNRFELNDDNGREPADQGLFFNDAVEKMVGCIKSKNPVVTNSSSFITSLPQTPAQVISIDYQNLMTTIGRDPTDRNKKIKQVSFNADYFVEQVYRHLECRVGWKQI